MARVLCACAALGLLQAAAAFLPTAPLLRPQGLRASRAAVTSVRAYTEEQPQKMWQDLAEQIADPFVNPLKKPSIAAELLALRQDVTASLQKVVRREVGLEEELLGKRSKKQLKATRAVFRQVSEDIIPGLSNEIRSLRDSDLQTTGSKGLKELQKTITDTFDDISAEGRFPELPTVQEIRKTIQQEARAAIFGDVGELEQPAYSVVTTTDEYEVRDYAPMTLATRNMGNQTAESYTTRSGRTFSALAGFLFGKNNAGKTMSMTTPVFMNKGEAGETMSFVIPKLYSDDVPTPTDATVTVEITEPVRVAVREFPGFATNKEVELQRDALVAALEADGFTLPEALDVTVAQYNPPYTIPTVRRNEVLIKIDPAGMPDPRKSAAVDYEAAPTAAPKAATTAKASAPKASAKDTSADYIITTGKKAAKAGKEPSWEEPEWQSADDNSEKPGSGNKYLDDL